MTGRAVRFVVPGPPVPKGRARSFSRGGFVKHVTPEKTRTYEGIVAFYAAQAWRGEPLMLGPVCFEITAYMPMPTSKPKWMLRAMLAEAIWPTTKPDWDNLAKAVSDACNGLIYKDDSQVVEAHVRKVYSDRPRLYVRIKEKAQPHECKDSFTGNRKDDLKSVRGPGGEQGDAQAGPPEAEPDLLRAMREDNRGSS